ncbi:uncharacterized protein [Anser cygnoides]|uniref:uncharacterized protein isoform X2 n=1 Tax=Anser cygnoides TaxID=8845 RepID=UPI0034D27E15
MAPPARPAAAANGGCPGDSRARVGSAGTGRPPCRAPRRPAALAPSRRGARLPSAAAGAGGGRARPVAVCGYRGGPGRCLEAPAQPRGATPGRCGARECRGLEKNHLYS